MPKRGILKSLNNCKIGNIAIGETIGNGNMISLPLVTECNVLASFE